MVSICRQDAKKTLSFFEENMKSKTFKGKFVCWFGLTSKQDAKSQKITEKQSKLPTQAKSADV